MGNLCLLFLVGLATGLVSDKLLVASQSSSLTADDLYLEGHPSGNLPIDDEDGEDDKDFNSGSGSGSGDYGLVEKDKILRKFLNFSTTSSDKEVLPTQPTQSDNQTTRTPPVKHVEVTPSVSPDDVRDNKVPAVEPTSDWFKNKPNTSSMSPRQSTTISIDIIAKDLDMDNSLNRWDNSKDKEQEKEVPKPEEDNEIIPDGAKMFDGRYKEVTSESMWERTEVLAAVIACVVVGCVCAIFLLFILAYRMKKKDEGSYDLGDTKISATAYQKAPTQEFYA